MPQSRIIFSTSEPYFPAAKQELLAAFEGARVERLGPEVGCLEAEDLDIAAVVEACQGRPVVFVRHLMREVARIHFDNVSDHLDAVATAIQRHVEDAPVNDEPALQVWTTGQVPGNLRADELRMRLAD
ncbi:MAG: SAM-dependent methyltransferase, partial [Thermomicrobiales bacterium]